MNRGEALRHRGVVAVVEDDPTMRRVLRVWLEQEGFQVDEFERGGLAIEGVSQATSVVCLDLGLGDMSGVDVLRQLRVRDPHLCVVVITANTGVETVVEAMKAGAFDYLTKPIDGKRLIDTVSKAAAHRALHASGRGDGVDLEQNILSALAAQSGVMREVARHIERVLDNNVTVFLQGESGTGKEVVARIIHNNSLHRRGPFIAVNCAAVPASLQESELFGHEKGAFTGANASHKGKFEQAAGGTLFLDEVGEMAPATQATLLRVLQERVLVRVGGSTEVPVSARIISATHRDLVARVRAGAFREDLYYRMVVYPIQLPTLRERLDDLPALVGSLLHKQALAPARGIEGVSPDALEAMRRHHWPGNIRELDNVLQRACLACDGGEIGLAHLPPEIQSLMLTAPLPQRPALRSLPPPSPKPRSLRELEREAIREAIAAANGNMSAAAKILGVSRATLYRRLNDERLLDAGGTDKEPRD
jgi:DNA-binding NtrC family response regulator